MRNNDILCLLKGTQHECLIYIDCEIIITIGLTKPSSHIDIIQKKKGEKSLFDDISEDLLSQLHYILPRSVNCSHYIEIMSLVFIYLRTGVYTL